jgi:hypothetical protein
VLQADPATVADPEVGSSTPMSIRMAVVFPAPFAPRNPNTSPGSTWKVIASTAVKVPKRRVRARASMAWLVIGMSVSAG